MIKSIRLKNIQAHKDSKLEFDKGINAIVGTSNNGKSTIIRALNWNRYNRPLGIDTLASHWIVDDKGNLKDEMSVTIENDFGTVTRKRTKTENQYIVNDKELNVVKSDVPLEVEQILNLSETNIQNQQDSPFLLSETSGKVAEYFNRIVRLDIIDRVLSKAETTRRKTNQEIQVLENNIKNNEKKLEDFSWLVDVEKLLNKIERVTLKNTQLKQNEKELLNKIIEYKNQLRNQRNLTDSKEILNTIEQELENNNRLNENYNSLKSEIEKYKNCKIYPDFNSNKDLIKQIEKELNCKENLNNQIVCLVNVISNYKNCIHNIELNKEKIIELKKQLPEICPICGSKMKNGECINENDN